jgi:hypothetical protein
MNKISFITICVLTHSCLFSMDTKQQPLPNKLDNGPRRDGILRKLSNPVSRVRTDEEIGNFMLKTETRSPRDKYREIYKEEKNKELNEFRRGRSESLEKK